jgi:tetratricopeptide (TPR) repeat protein
MRYRSITALVVILLAAGLSVAQTNGNDNSQSARGKEYYEDGVKQSDHRRWDMAIMEFDRAIGLGYSVPEVYHERAAAKAGKGDYRAALEDLDKAISLRDSYLNAYYFRGQVKSRLKDYAGAEADFTAALRLSKVGEPALYKLRAVARENRGDLAGAIADRTQVIGTSWDNWLVEALYERGRVYLKKGDRQLAFADFDRAIKLDPESGGAYEARGDAYYKLGEYAKAELDLERAAVTAQNYDYPLFHSLGHTYLALGKVAAAKTAFEKAIAGDPKVGDFHSDLGQIALREGEFQLGLEKLNTAVDLDPKSHLFLYWRAWANLYLRRGKEAAADADKARALADPKSKAEAQDAIIGYLALRRADEYEKADSLLMTWLQEKPAATEWSTKVMLFFAHRLTDQQLLAAAGMDKIKLTAAHAYIGEFALLDTNDIKTAKRHFDWIRLNGERFTPESMLATAELRALNGTP